MILKACLYLFMLPWQRHIRRLRYQKSEICVVNLRVVIFGDQSIKGLEKKENETQISILCSNCMRSIGNQGRFAIDRMIFVLQISKGACDSEPVFQ